MLSTINALKHMNNSFGDGALCCSAKASGCNSNLMELEISGTSVLTSIRYGKQMAIVY